MMPSRVLITGVGGFIGSHLLQHIFENTDWNVIGTDSWAHKGTPERVEQVLAKNPEWRDRLTIITHDLSVLFPERTKQRIGQCDYIVNVASDSHVDRSIDDPVPFVRNNVNLMLTMLEFAREYPPKTFLQVSTDEVYGVAPDGLNHKEWSPIVPSNPYAASKAAQEAICISYWRTYGVPLVITNTLNNFGEMQDAEKYMAKIIRAVENDDTVTVHGKEGDIGSRFYMHARNHADAILHILQNLPPAKYTDGQELRPDRYNVVGETEMNNLEVAQSIAECMGKELKYEFVDYHATRPGHDRRYALDGTKLKEAGWVAPISFSNALTRYIAWTRLHPTWF